jgi:mannose-6-phosphate isomerase-like protein (cupin superfamily)
MQNDVDGVLADDALPVDLDAILVRIGLRSELRNDTPVHTDAPFGDQPLGRTPRSDASTREDFLESVDSHLVENFLLLGRAMRRVEKPWGYEIIWAETDRYVGKVLHINAGHRLSRQYHNKKEETFLIEAGEMDLEVGQGAEQRTIRMKQRDSFHCKPLTVHRMVAVTDVDVIEVSTPELDDVVRLEDVYGREGTSKP